MFQRILIANRGEIACRVIDTCRRLGVQTVAVYSDADAGARHVAMADHSVRLGPAPAADSYLRADRIVAAALETGAEAVHPGYGFLSENPGFVDAVEAAGLVFIGPSADAIRAMGLKDAAKDRVAAAGVPVVPGYQGADQNDTVLAREAGGIGYPVLIKAVAGGGGKGMRLVAAPGDFAGALRAARAEAQAAFGNERVLIERFVQHPRHIEVQIFGDGTRAVHLFERDCSLQRRHQKVIEEAPAPGMTDALRAAMGNAAVRAAEAIGYKGAGTVEFIVEGAGDLREAGFYFMEMNTRLQVEHPVTEAITGVDLVEWQLRVASGEGLPLTQDQLRIDGHAFEARLYAEDVPAGFLPATGTLTHLAFPPGARAETGVRAGDAISPFYDPMIAKIIVHGPTRAIALGQLRAALAETQVAGSVTNLAFLRALAAHEGFGRGDVDTGLIARDLDGLTAVPAPQPRDIAAAALMAAGLWEAGPAYEGAHLWAPLTVTVPLDPGGPVRLTALGGGTYDVAGDGWTIAARRGWTLDGQAAPLVVRHGQIITVFSTASHTFTIPDPLDRIAAAGIGAGVVEAPMPGLIRALHVVPGDAVAQGDLLAVLEAMKMEHVLRAPRDGIVAEVLAQAGQQVDAKTPLIVLEDPAP